MVSGFASMKDAVQYISLVLSLFLNGFLMFLIKTRSPKKMGSYKLLMSYFCVFSIIFTIMDIFIQPYIITYGTSFLMVINMKGRILSRNLAFEILCAHTGCFAVSLFIIAIHFIFRYFALERKGRLQYFQGQYLLIWFCIPFIAGANWSLISYFFYSPKQELTGYIKDFIYEEYELNTTDITYVGGNFYKQDGILDKTTALAFSNLIFLMLSPLIIVIYYGRKSFIRIQELTKEGESSYSKTIQKQLYKALVIQTVLPISIMFVPFGIFFFGALLNLQLDNLSRFVTFSYAIYPVVDPIPIIFVVDDYRNSLFFTRFFKKTQRVGIQREEEDAH